MSVSREDAKRRGIKWTRGSYNYGACPLCGKPVPHERSKTSHYCSKRCAALVAGVVLGRRP